MSYAAGTPGRRDSAPLLHRPAEVAKMLRCSEWWIKEQARKRRIPFSWIGGSYLFTDDHVAEIIRLFEEPPIRARFGSIGYGRCWKKAAGTASDTKTKLKARTPRRALNARRAPSDAA